MKDLLLFPFKILKYGWGGIAVMLIGGICLNMPDFLLGVGIGAAILYFGLIIYKLITQLHDAQAGRDSSN